MSTALSRQPVQATPPALKASPAGAATATGQPPADQFPVLRGTKPDLLSMAVFTDGKTPPAPPPPGGGTVAKIELNPLTILCDLLDGGIQDLDEEPGIIEGILQFIDSLPKPS